VADTNIEFTNEGIALLNATPFFPNTYYEDGVKKVIFNQGYVINYGSTDYLEENPNHNIFTNGEGFLATIKVANLGPFEIPPRAEGYKFYVEIKTEIVSSVIEQVNLKLYVPAEITTVPANFHYSTSVNQQTSYYEPGNPGASPPDGQGQYSDGRGIFRVPLCSFNSDSMLDAIILRENIHWQKIGFVSEVYDFGSRHPTATVEIPPDPDDPDDQGSEEAEAMGLGKADILGSWGDSEQNFGVNPSVRFKSIRAGFGIEIVDLNNTLIIRNTHPDVGKKES
jgi:hypothetical protein